MRFTKCIAQEVAKRGDIENDETVEVSVEAIEQGLEEVNLIRDGKNICGTQKTNSEWKIK